MNRGGSVNNVLKRGKDESLIEYQIRLGKNKDLYGLDWNTIAKLLNGEVDEEYGESKWRKEIQAYVKVFDYLNENEVEVDSEEPVTNYKETVEILKDGSHKSDKLLKMSAEQSKDVDFLLEAHGYDKNEWELTSARSNIWNVYSKVDKTQTLYSSKITVKPKKAGLDFEKLLETISKVKPFNTKIKPVKVKQKRLLEIPLFDQHFGISDFEYYKTTQERIYERINNIEDRWEEVLFIIGQDMFHNNNHKGQTANSTVIESVDMDKAWGDAEKFYIPLIKHAFKKSNNVYIKYSKGNHDESISWCFIKMLKQLFPEAIIDDSFQERKIHTFGKVFIGITHGDKGRKNLHNIFPVEFPEEWSKSTVREIHTGHFHKEDGKDIFGMMIRTLSTRNKTDQWHRDMGYVGSHKRFMLFEYSEDELLHIHYV